jgi:hypothetical protein
MAPPIRGQGSRQTPCRHAKRARINRVTDAADPLSRYTRKDRPIHACDPNYDQGPDGIDERLKGDRISCKRHTAGRFDIGNKMREIAWNQIQSRIKGRQVVVDLSQKYKYIQYVAVSLPGSREDLASALRLRHLFKDTQT